MLKKLLIFLLFLVVILAGVGYYIFSNIDSIAKDLIEESGTNVMGTDVKVESVSIEFKEGRATINNLSVANPPGFSENPAFRFGEITAVVEISTGIVRRIYTNQPEIRVEFRGDQSNFDVLNKNIQASARKGQKDKPKEPGDKKDPEKDPVQLRIDEVEIENARAIVIRDDGGEPLELIIERLHFENLEGSPEQIARVMLGQFVAQVLAETAKRALEKKVDAYIEKKQGELKEKLSKKLEQLLN
jgi:hypothetical protein